MTGRLGQCGDLTARRVSEMVAAREARSTVENRYLDGHCALFPDIAAAFDDHVRRSERLAVLAAESSEFHGVEPVEPGDPHAVSFRVEQLVADLVEPAKSTALDKLGEGRPACRNASTSVRAKLRRRRVA